MAQKLQIRRGLKAKLPTLAPGELGLCEDTGEVFIGSAKGNLPLRSGTGAGDMLKSVYDADSDGVVDKAESVSWAGVTGKPATFAPSSHTHTKSQITDMPASMPANGGNADTVDGKHAADFRLQANAGEIYRRQLNSGATLGGLGPGRYVSDYSANAFPDAPAGADTAFILDVDGVQTWDNNYLQQFLTDNVGRSYYRRKSGSSWTAWVGPNHADDSSALGGMPIYSSTGSSPYWYLAYAGTGNKDGTMPVYYAKTAGSADKVLDRPWEWAYKHGAPEGLWGKISSTTALYYPSELTVGKATSAEYATYANNRVIYYGTESAYIHSPANQQLYFWASRESDRGLFFGVAGVWTLCPNTNNSLWLGAPNYRWNQIYSTQTSISTSDRNRKTDIQSLDTATALSFLRLLQPVSYKMLDGSSGRTHWGLIAQDVWDAMQRVGLSDRDFAGYCRDAATERVQVIHQVPMTDPQDGDVLGMEDVLKEEDVPVIGADGTPEYIYGLRYEEFIPLALLGAQEALRRAEALEAENTQLKETLAALTAQQCALDRRLAALEAK